MIFVACLTLGTLASEHCNPYIVEEGHEAAVPCMCLTDTHPDDGVKIEWHLQNKGTDYIGSRLYGQSTVNQSYEGRITIDGDSQLVLNETSMSDAGLYRCLVKYPVSTIEFMTDLLVNGEYNDCMIS